MAAIATIIATSQATDTAATITAHSACYSYIDYLDHINLPTRKEFIHNTANLILQARASRAE